MDPSCLNKHKSSQGARSDALVPVPGCTAAFCNLCQHAPPSCHHKAQRPAQARASAEQPPQVAGELELSSCGVMPVRVVSCTWMTAASATPPSFACCAQDHRQPCCACKRRCLPAWCPCHSRNLGQRLAPAPHPVDQLVPTVTSKVGLACYVTIPGSCCWWCQGRMWADHIQLHPVFATAVRCLLAAAKQGDEPNLVVKACVGHHADLLPLQAQFTRSGLRLAPLPSAIASICAAAPQSCAPNGHTLRDIARACALATVRPDRLDSEPVHDVDLQAQSHTVWKRWKQSLSEVDQALLRIRRGGTVKTRTRRW